MKRLFVFLFTFAPLFAGAQSDLNGVFALYATDKTLALSALDRVYETDAKLLSGAKKFSSSASPKTRMGAAGILGDYGGVKEQKVLFKMLKKETEPAVSHAIARAIARHPVEAQAGVAKCLGAKPGQYATGCILTAALLTDKGIPVIKEGLASRKTAVKANSIDAAKLMLDFLSIPDAPLISTNPEADKRALKELVPLLSVLTDDKDKNVAGKADAALERFARLLI